MEHTAHAYTAPGLADRSRVAHVLGDDTLIVRAALALVALHVLDDNILQPEPGTSAANHLLSGLVPIAVLALAAWLYPRLRAGLRAATVMTFGAIGIVVGSPTVYYLTEGSRSGDHYTGLLALVTGVLLLSSGPVMLWKARDRNESRKRRYKRRALTTIVGLVLAFLLTWLVVFPIGLAYIYTHTGRLPATPELGVPAEKVTVTTSDSLDLAAWYVPSINRAAIVLFPGASRTEEARMLIRHGYGVLLLEPRGQGGSEGDIVRWAGDQDVLAGAAFLRNRPDVDPGRIGAIGFSIGGENLLEAAAQSTAFAAVVSEGAGERFGEADTTGFERLLMAPAMTITTAALTVLSNHRSPPPIAERIERIAPTPVFLVYADPGIGGENTRQPQYYAAAKHPKQIWKVPGAQHTGGMDAQPHEYERRVATFFDNALLDTP